MKRVQIRGLPEGDYQVQCKSKDGWEKLFRTILPHTVSVGAEDHYYKFGQDGSCNLRTSKFDNVEEVSYEHWKECIENHIAAIGDYKVGDQIIILRDCLDCNVNEIHELKGFDGENWWITTKNYSKHYLGLKSFRHATKEEISANEKKKETRELLSIKTGDGLDVYKGDDMHWVEKINGTWRYSCNCTINLVHLEPGNTLSTGNWQVFHTKEAADAWIEEVNKPVAPVRQDGWKVGDKLPVEFLNLCTYYTRIHAFESSTSVEDDEVEWDEDRVVKSVTSKGWAEISGTLTYYLSPKHEYPEYDHYEKPKTAAISESSGIIVTKANAGIGMKVVRGRDWDYNKQDHFEGKPSVGTIIKDSEYFPCNERSGWVKVRWKHGGNDIYKIGLDEEDWQDDDEKYDLYVYQNSKEPVQKPVTPTPSKSKEVKKPIFVQCVDMDMSTADFVVGRVYEVIKEDGEFYYFAHTEGGMFKRRFKEVKGNAPIEIPVGWKPGDKWRHKDNSCGAYITTRLKHDDFNSYFIDYGEYGTGWVSVKQINDFVKNGLWVINPEQKGRQEEKQNKMRTSKKAVSASASQNNASSAAAAKSAKQPTYLEIRKESQSERDERDLQYEVENNLDNLMADIRATSRELNKAQRERIGYLQTTSVSWSSLAAHDAKIAGFEKGLATLKEYRETYFPNWQEMVTEA